ncbi:Hypothetical predicted protein [Lecanosticta acicola]|uniref:Uncharacterized protein n=1 Tax=Lecanosticta acicola TaxID=111012 RepID=A0AAI9EED6_9PEZI|nr:Hypothetical predicted protein [Lecanosticta acicola]
MKFPMMMRITRALAKANPAIALLTLMAFHLTTAHAIPVPQTSPSTSTPTIPTNKATCTTSYRSEGHGAGLFYAVQIGRPYIEGRGCPSIKALLSEKAIVVEFKCIDDGLGQTNLTFGTPADRKTNEKVIQALQKAYPMVPFEENGICNISDATLLRRGYVDSQTSSGANATPLPEPSPDDKKDATLGRSTLTSISKRSTLQQGTSWCTRRPGWFSNKAIFEIHIGTAYHAGSDSATIKAHISEKMTIDDISFSPKGSEASNTKLILEISDIDDANLSHLNAALGNAYPGILFTCDPDEADETVFKRTSSISISPRSSPVARNTSHCGKKWQPYFSNGEQKKLLVTVGRPFLGGIRCADVADLIGTKFALDDLWCEGSSRGDMNTRLWVFAGVKTKDFGGINEGLRAAYPMVEGFGCPTS